MLCPRRIATTVLLLLLGLALLGQPAALSTPRSPGASTTAAGDPGEVTDVTVPLSDPDEPSTTLPSTSVPEDEEGVSGEGEPGDDGAVGEEVPGDEGTDVTTEIDEVDPGDDGEVPVGEEDPTVTTVVPGDDDHAAEGSPTAAPAVAPDLSVATTTSKLVAQVGDGLGYKTHVTNLGADTLTDVTVIAVLAPELSVDALPLTEDVKAAQIGSSARGEDIVWVLEDLAPNQTVHLPWKAIAAARGNLRAEVETEAKVLDVSADAEDVTTYLATAHRRAPNNPAPTIKKKVVTVHSEVVPAEEAPLATLAPAPQPAAEGLPLTGFDPKPLVIFAGVLVLLGALFVWAPAWFDRRLLLVIALVALSACVDATNDQAGESPDVATASTTTTLPAEVKGKRIERNKDKEPGDDTSGEGDETSPTTTSLPFQGPDTTSVDPTDGTDGSSDGGVVAQGPAPTVTTLVREVEVVTVPMSDLDVARLAATEGDNSISIEWDEADGPKNIVSGINRLLPDPPVEIMTNVTNTKGSIAVDVVITNLQDRTRLAVSGKLVHVIETAGGKSVARLVSDPIDLVLNPGGTVTRHFTYLLPTGTYGLSSQFEAK